MTYYLMVYFLMALLLVVIHEVLVCGPVKAAFEEIVAVLMDVFVFLLQDDAYVVLHQSEVDLYGTGHIHARPCVAADVDAAVGRIDGRALEHRIFRIVRVDDRVPGMPVIVPSMPLTSGGSTMKS